MVSTYGVSFAKVFQKISIGFGHGFRPYLRAIALIRSTS